MTAETTDTAGLLERLHSGDEAALREIVERHLRWLEHNVRRQLSPALRRRGETGDFLHEAVVYVLRHGPKFVISDENHCRAILARMVQNMLRDKARWSAAMQRDLGRERPVAGDSVLFLDPPVRAATAAGDVAERNEDEAMLRFCVELLPPAAREVVLLRYWHDLPFEEIGRILDMTPEGARTRHHRAMNRLARVSHLVRRGQIEEVLERPETPRQGQGGDVAPS